MVLRRSDEEINIKNITNSEAMNGFWTEVMSVPNTTTQTPKNKKSKVDENLHAEESEDDFGHSDDKILENGRKKFHPFTFKVHIFILS